MHLSGSIVNWRAKQFTYENIKSRKQTFQYLCGVSSENFDMFFECVQSYLHLIPYPDCPNTIEKTVSNETQFFSVLTVCRHGLDLKFMSFLLEKSYTTVHRIFTGWVIFCATLFNEINLKVDGSFLLKKMPDIFVKTGNGLTDIVIDIVIATEFKFQQASNFDLSSLMFSHYKNTHTGKAFIGIAPHGMGIFFSDTYPGSISDSEITEKSGILSLIREDHEVMSDKGFAKTELCLSKGIYLNQSDFTFRYEVRHLVI
ncbi:uncharacterized protein LOC136096642 [Hydra vulgaris]|uniref:uncharacterized protein LOC136096642 n=1 Tax=Hydra vulgaris TaxID=6087 RepID=UPI0032EA4F54